MVDCGCCCWAGCFAAKLVGLEQDWYGTGLFGSGGEYCPWGVKGGCCCGWCCWGEVVGICPWRYWSKWFVDREDGGGGLGWFCWTKFELLEPGWLNGGARCCCWRFGELESSSSSSDPYTKNVKLNKIWIKLYLRINLCLQKMP